MADRAAAYCELSLWGISLSQSASSLRHWWQEEAGHREEYGLSQEQIDMLADACRDRIRDLGEIAKDKPEELAPRRSSKQRRRAAI